MPPPCQFIEADGFAMRDRNPRFWLADFLSFAHLLALNFFFEVTSRYMIRDVILKRLHGENSVTFDKTRR